MRSRADLFPAELKIEAFLTGLAVHGKVAAATQNVDAPARKYPHAAGEWGWQYIFPARSLSVNPRTGITRRHHLDPSVINKAIKATKAFPALRTTSVFDFPTSAKPGNRCNPSRMS